MNELRTILVVEDDSDISEAVVAILGDYGYSVVVSANGQEALVRLRTSVPLPRLILLDLMMPVMDGWQFRAAQSADPALAAIPVVLCSADVGVAKAAEQLAVAGWLRKPVDIRALIAVLDMHLV
jgi:two-component system chemotaxis response regulator CheY